MKWDTFWEQFSIKIDEQINAKIHTEKVMKFDETNMWELIELSILSEKCANEKTYFLEKANVRKPYDSCSRIRVREGSVKNKKIRKNRTILNISSPKKS